jgi:hypothetical protein
MVMLIETVPLDSGPRSPAIAPPEFDINASEINARIFHFE